MASKKPKTVSFRRKREGKTNYPKRLKLLLAGKPRLVVRFTNQKVIGQIISFVNQGDKVVVGVDSLALKKLGWNYSLKNMPATYLTGLLLGKTALEKGCQEAVLDTGSKTPLAKGKTYAFLKGVVDGGLKVPVGKKEVFPSEERIQGQHITKSEGIKEKFEEVKNKLSS